MIVVDANVVLSALRSSRGASHQLLRRMLAGDVPFAVSTAIALEYEDVLKRPGILGAQPWIQGDEIDTVLDTIFSQAGFPTFSFPAIPGRPQRRHFHAVRFDGWCDIHRQQ